MPKAPYDCSYCGELFERAKDHMSHVVSKHDIGFRSHGEASPMPYLRCWRCAAEAPRRADSTYACTKCGFVIPTKEQLQDEERTTAS